MATAKRKTKRSVARRVSNPSRKVRSAKPTYYYSLYREVTTPESAEEGDLDHTDEIARDAGPYRSLKALLDDAGANSESWEEWSSSRPTGRDWLISASNVDDYRTGEESRLSLHIRGPNDAPISARDVAYLTDALGLRGYRNPARRAKVANPARRRKASPKRKANGQFAKTKRR